MHAVKVILSAALCGFLGLAQCAPMAQSATEQDILRSHGIAGNLLDELTSRTARVLGRLDSSRVTSVTHHPLSEDMLLYSDETHVYEFYLKHGTSHAVAGVKQRGLRSGRKAQDGIGGAARFVFITKLVTRGQRVYVFDNNHLRAMDFHPVRSSGEALGASGVPAVSTVGILSSNSRRPVTGTVSHDGSSVIWYTVTDRAGAIYTADLMAGGSRLAPKELLSYQRSSLSYCSIAADDTVLYVVDESYNTIREVHTVTGRTRLIARGEKFGPVVVDASGSIIAIDLSGPDGDGKLIRINPVSRKTEVICGTEDGCITPFSYLQDIMVQGNSLLVVDAAYWPRSEATLKRLAL